LPCAEAYSWDVQKYKELRGEQARNNADTISAYLMDALQANSIAVERSRLTNYYNRPEKLATMIPAEIADLKRMISYYETTKADLVRNHNSSVQVNTNWAAQHVSTSERNTEVTV
jgi:hypothetical protein